jgi:FtsP/CotA-like multicopper oxidase with cupredoxin domain
MSKASKTEYSRRDFLRLGWSIGAGFALPATLSGCIGGGDDSEAALPAETFLEPLRLQSLDGRLDVTLQLSYLKTSLNGKAVTLRSMYASIPAPTMSLNAGDTLRVLVVNQLPANPPSTEPVTHLRYPNSTNLHMHGLHVTPGIVSPGVYGDFVMDDPQLGVQPGESRQHEYAIRPDHPPGAYWYHPHLHGSTAIQIGSGMAGALLIRGAIDDVPEIAAARERVFMFQAPISNDSGLLESFSQVADNPIGEPPFLINGVRRPRLVMRRGEVQNWHFINAAIFNFLNLSLDDHALHVYSQDGNTRARPQPIGPITPSSTVLQQGIVLAPANRASVLVQAGAPGTYFLRTLKFQMGTSAATLPEDIVAEVVVLDEHRPMNLPDGPLPIPAPLAPITDEELARAGGLKRSIVMFAVSNPPPGRGEPNPPITEPPASDIVHPGNELNDWIYQTDDTSMANKVWAIGAASGESSISPGLPNEYIPFQSSHALHQTVALGSVEEWTVFNMNNIRHPFHIHINPCWVIKINGAPIEPYWADTIPLPPGGSPEQPTSVTFRSRFTDFTGAYVMHCHMLAHEDMGMMQTINVV